jgi:SulP family sulfate permease
MNNEKIEPFSLITQLRTYELKNVKKDLWSAFSVALLALPQSMAYAFIADLPTATGIFSAIFGTIFTASFGASRRLISGPTNTLAIILQSGTAEILYTYYRSAVGIERELLALNILTQLVLLIGIFQLVGGLFKLGRLIRFISRPVVIGYMIGAGSVIIITQLFPFLGIQKISGYYPAYQQAWYLLSHLYNFHLVTMLLGVASLVALIFLYRISKKIPAAAIVLFGTALIVYFFNLSPKEAKSTFDVMQGGKSEKVTLIGDMGPLHREFPKVKLPYFDLRIMTKAIPLAFAVALLGIIEVIAVGRTYHRSKDPPYRENQEIYGLGISNFFCSFLGALPASGSFSRSHLNNISGGKTRLAAIFSGLFVMLILFALSFLVTKIPLSALSALMLLTALSMVDPKELILCLRATKADAAVTITTFICSLLFGLEIALYVGVVLSIIFYLKQTAAPFFVEYGFNNIGKLRPLEEGEARDDPSIAIIQPEGELFFASAMPLQNKLHEISEDDSVKVIILQLMNTRNIDASVCIAIEEALQILQEMDRHLFLSGVATEVVSVMKHAGLLSKIGETHVFYANEKLPSEPTRQAYALAKSL